MLTDIDFVKLTEALKNSSEFIVDATSIRDEIGTRFVNQFYMAHGSTESSERSIIFRRYGKEDNEYIYLNCTKVSFDIPGYTDIEPKYSVSCNYNVSTRYSDEEFLPDAGFDGSVTREDYKLIFDFIGQFINERDEREKERIVNKIKEKKENIFKIL